MCGILGTTNLAISDDLFKIGLEKIKHRGPDNQSIKTSQYVKFGHTRLSILDLDNRSNQPFQYQHNNRTILITFNGEIYNYLLIKKDLIKKGYEFNTESDTEVVCAAFCEYGLNCFDFFEGMWAVAINEETNLIISRDRLGKKPLYISHSTNGNVHFSSSLKSVSILSGCNEVSEKGIELYFALGFIPKNHTIYTNISKIEPGTILHFEKENDSFTLKTLRQSNFKPNYNPESFSINQLLSKAVDKRLISDVPVTTLMSGGVDSTIVTSIINKIKPNTEAYFVDFDDKELSEKKWAEYLAKRNRIKLNTLFLNSKDLSDAFKNYYEVYEEPFADYSGIPSIAIFKEVSKKYKVVLTGDGGDELFYGYPHYYKKYILYKSFGLLKILSRFSFIPKNVKTIVRGDKKEFESNYLKNHAFITPFASNFINSNFNYNLSISKSFLRGIIAYDRNFYNWPEKYLVKVDRSSMFSGIEVRSPFMDENLSNKVKKTPLFLLFTPYSSKLFLKLKFFNLFGLKYFTSTKKGFTPPIENLREVNFQEQDFNDLKKYLKNHCPNLFLQIVNLDFVKLKKDKILFDRFFLFNEWKKLN